MNCSQCRKMLSAFIDHEVSNPKPIEAHLSNCSHCTAQLTRLRAAEQMLSRIQAPSQLLNRVVSAPFSEQSQSPRIHRDAPSWGTLLLAIVGLSVAAGSSYFLFATATDSKTNSESTFDEPKSKLPSRIQIRRAGHALDQTEKNLISPGDKITFRKSSDIPWTKAGLISATPGTELELLSNTKIKINEGQARFDLDSRAPLSLQTPAGHLVATNCNLSCTILAQGSQTQVFISVHSGSLKLITQGGEVNFLRSGEFHIAGPLKKMSTDLKGKAGADRLSLELANKRILQLEQELKAARGTRRPETEYSRKTRSLVKRGQRAPTLTDIEYETMVQALIQNHSWKSSARALRRQSQAKMGGRSLSFKEKKMLNDFFDTLKKLNDIGVGFFDKSVAQAFVPAWILSFGISLDSTQVDQLREFLKNRTKPRLAKLGRVYGYPECKIEDLQWTISLEIELSNILSNDQLKQYLNEVGDSPFTSGLALKTRRISVLGLTRSEQIEEVFQFWMTLFDVGKRDSHIVQSFAERFVADVNGIMVNDQSFSPWQQRQACLNRAVKTLQFQGQAEWELFQRLTNKSPTDSYKTIKSSVIEFRRR